MSASASHAALTLQLLEWIAARPRRHREVLQAWQSTCPNMSIWEDACIEGLIDSGPDGIMRLSEKGMNRLRSIPAAP